jgi:hypothetical protein
MVLFPLPAATGGLESGRGDDNGICRADMFTESAACAFIGDHRILAPFQAHGPPLDWAPFIAASTDQMFLPGKAFFAVKYGKAHSDLFNGHIMEGIGRADLTAAHTEMTGSFLGINLRSSCHKKVEAPAHLDTVKDTYLGTLTTLQAAGKKLFFISGTGRTEKFILG